MIKVNAKERGRDMKRESAVVIGGDISAMTRTARLTMTSLWRPSKRECYTYNKPE